MYFNTKNCVKAMICDVAMLYVKTMVCGFEINSLEITFISNPARSDVKISLAHAHGNRLIESYLHWMLVIQVKFDL